MRRSLAALWWMALGLTACRSESSSAAPPIAHSAPTASTAETGSASADPLAQAQRAAQDFSAQLRAALHGAMQAGGADAAVAVCHDAAPAIAEQVMREHGVRLGRVARPGRQRNPQHAAHSWPLHALQAMDAAVRAGADPGQQVRVQREGLGDRVALRMVRGIPTEALCLTCHGAAVEPALKAKILELYPTDGATGFTLGELRGALWVEVPTATAR